MNAPARAGTARRPATVPDTTPCFPGRSEAQIRGPPLRLHRRWAAVGELRSGHPVRVVRGAGHASRDHARASASTPFAGARADGTSIGRPSGRAELLLDG